jgi:hypothetical protein
MDIRITSINFQYQNGSNAAYTGINVNFNGSAGNFSVNGYVPLTPEQYQTTNGSTDQLITLVKQQIVSTITGQTV